MSKIKNGGLDQYGAGPSEQRQCGTAGAERDIHVQLSLPVSTRQEGRQFSILTLAKELLHSPVCSSVSRITGKIDERFSRSISELRTILLWEQTVKFWGWSIHKWPNGSHF